MSTNEELISALKRVISAIELVDPQSVEAWEGIESELRESLKYACKVTRRRRRLKGSTRSKPGSCLDSKP